MGSGHHVFLASMAAYVALILEKISIGSFTNRRSPRALLAEHRVDALMAFPPIPQELRRKNIGRVIVKQRRGSTMVSILCCVVAANREFVRQNPVATKRHFRAILKATDICALSRNEPPNI